MLAAEIARAGQAARDLWLTDRLAQQRVAETKDGGASAILLRTLCSAGGCMEGHDGPNILLLLAVSQAASASAPPRVRMPLQSTA